MIGNKRRGQYRRRKIGKQQIENCKRKSHSSSAKRCIPHWRGRPDESCSGLRSFACIPRIHGAQSFVQNCLEAKGEKAKLLDRKNSFFYINGRIVSIYAAKISCGTLPRPWRSGRRGNSVAEDLHICFHHLKTRQSLAIVLNHASSSRGRTA